MRSTAVVTTTLLCFAFAACEERRVPASGANAANVVPAAGIRSDAPPKGQLGDGVRPSHYALDLRVVPADATFSGVVRIDVEIAEPTRVIWMHGRGLRVKRVFLEGVAKDALAGVWKQVDGEGLARLDFDRSVGPAKRATLHFEYEADWSRGLRGLYRVKEGGRDYAFTQFEPISARNAFPAFDEPRFKATFDVSLRVPATDAAVSNAPAVSETPVAQGHKRVRFARTPRLSTYLVALAVGPFDVVAAPDIPPNDVRKVKVPLRGLAAKGKGELLRYMLSRTGPLLAVIERYFGIAYPFDKLDLIAVPDFSAGAMENAGAITFREVYLLVDEKTASIKLRRRAYRVLAHELAHQWFGDLVTMRWFDDIWLNEAFAAWLANVAVDLHDPEQGGVVVQRRAAFAAMDADSFVSARRIRQPIETHHDIRNAFDAITYSKGSAVLGMFERFIGRARFRRGLQRYLTEHRFGNATSDQFLAALSSTAERDVATPMGTFIHQTGVPQLEIEPLCEGPIRVRLRQSRYWPLGSEGGPQQRWQVPVCLRFAAAGPASEIREHCALLEKQDEVWTFPPGSGCPAWIHPNADGAGYYRFALSPASWAALRRAAPRLKVSEQLAIVDSVRAGFAAGKISTQDASETLVAMSAGAPRAVFETVTPFFDKLRKKIVSSDTRGAVEGFVQRRFAPSFARLGGTAGPRRTLGRASGEAAERKLLHRSALMFMAFVGRDPRVRKDLARRAASLFARGGGAADLSRVAPELLGPVLEVGIQEAGAATLGELEKLLRAGKLDASTRETIIAALGHATDAEVAARVRALVFDPALRANEVITVVVAQLGQVETRDAAWAWLQGSLDAVLRKLPPNHTLYLPMAARSFCSHDRAREVETFLTAHVGKLLGGPRSVRASVEAIRLCAAVAKRHAAEAHAYFARRAGTPASAPQP